MKGRVEGQDTYRNTPNKNMHMHALKHCKKETNTKYNQEEMLT